MGGRYVDEDFDLLLNKRGLLARLFRPAFSLVTSSWHMLPIGLLFGLGLRHRDRGEPPRYLRP